MDEQELDMNETEEEKLRRKAVAEKVMQVFAEAEMTVGEALYVLQYYLDPRLHDVKVSLRGAQQ
jgi:hypothetical protein